MNAFNANQENNMLSSELSDEELHTITGGWGYGGYGDYENCDDGYGNGYGNGYGGQACGCGNGYGGGYGMYPMHMCCKRFRRHKCFRHHCHPYGMGY